MSDLETLETPSPTPSPPERPIFHSPKGSDGDDYGSRWTDRIDGILNSPSESAAADDEKSPTPASSTRRARRRGTIELPRDFARARPFGRRPSGITVEDAGTGPCPFTELQRAKRRASFRADEDEAEAENRDGPDGARPGPTGRAGPRFVPPETRHDSLPFTRPRFVPSGTPNEASPSVPSCSIAGRPVFVPPGTDHDEVRNDRICRLFDDARRQLPSSDVDGSERCEGWKKDMPRFVPPVEDYDGAGNRPTFVPPVDPYDDEDDEDCCDDDEDGASGASRPRPRCVPPVMDDDSVNDGDETNSRVCRILREGNLDVSFSSKMPRTVPVRGAGAYVPSRASGSVRLDESDAGSSRFSRPKFRPCRTHLQDDDDEADEVSSVAAVKDPKSDRPGLPDFSEDSRRKVAEIASRRPMRRRGTIEVPAEMRRPVGSPVADGPAKKEARRPRRRRGTIEMPDSAKSRPVGTPVVDVEKPSKMRTKLERSSRSVCSHDSEACVGAVADGAAVDETEGGVEDPDTSDTSLSRRLEARLAAARRIREKLGSSSDDCARDEKSNKTSRGDKTGRKRRVTIEGPCPFTALQVDKLGRQNSSRSMSPKQEKDKPARRPARARRATVEGGPRAVPTRRPSYAGCGKASSPGAFSPDELRSLRNIRKESLSRECDDEDDDYAQQQQPPFSPPFSAGELSELRGMRSTAPSSEPYPVGTPVEDSTLNWAVGDSHRSGGTAESLTLDRIAEIKARFDRRQRGSRSRLDESTKSSSTHESITVDNLLDDSARTDTSEARGRRRSTASDVEDVFEAHNSSFVCDNDCRSGEDITDNNDGPSKPDSLSRWNEALSRYRRDGKSADRSASEDRADDLPEDEVGRRGSRSMHASFPSLWSSSRGKSDDAPTEPTAAMSSSSFCLAEEGGFDDAFLSRSGGAAVGRSRVGSHINVRPLLDESVSSLEGSARSSEVRIPGRPDSDRRPERRSGEGTKKKSSKMRRRATADCAEDVMSGLRNVMKQDPDGEGRAEPVRSRSRVTKGVDEMSGRKFNGRRRRRSVCDQ